MSDVCDVARLLLVAPGIFVHVVLSGDDCHWYVWPVPDVPPVIPNEKFVPEHAGLADAVTVPGVGGSIQAPVVKLNPIYGLR